ncbi:MAG: hypothetical protein E7316_01945 [Clostridiales bacterium]|nr:hypothetical protein [Clostridiales bacterium]
MPENIYEIISLGARYWFAFLGVLIVWRAFRWLRKDRKANHRRLRQLPDAGMIGEMVVLQGSDELPEGYAIPIPREGVLGFVRSCDVVIPVNGVAARHLDFSFQPGTGLLLFPLRGAVCYVDDAEVTHRSKTKKHPMGHGSRLQVGQAVLRLRLFAGLDASYRPYYPYVPEYPPCDPDQPVTQDWQDNSYVYHQQPSPWQEEPVYDQAQQAPWPEQQAPWQQPAAPWQENPAPWQQSPNPWQQEEPMYGQEQPVEESWLNPPVQQGWMPQQPEPFQPAQARQRHSRAQRRRYDEE